MARALRLAARGLTSAHPNPRVGCVLVRDGEVVGEGFHVRAGGPHAEVEALRAAGARARGATAYVSLEPCNHHGRTPPCTEALLAAGVAAVVAPITDPDPRVAGSGFAALERAGVAVRRGVLAREAEALNEGFIKRMRTGRPLLRAKVAASLDGRSALADGRSRWITSPEARADAQAWRARSGAIVTGIGTVLADDPRLTVRDAAGAALPDQPLRVVLDARGRLPAGARLLAEPGRTLLLTTGAGRGAARDGLEVVALPDDGAGRIALGAVLDELGRREVNEALVEAGPTLTGALLAAGLVDELLYYMAPLLLGDRARAALALPEPGELASAPALEVRELRAVGRDWRVLARPVAR
jgi:diaminohydroxyphosphoribosylaminopyrimidine deaminase/5-amino-6-(5-phosphoribosylamino)uracil reductase